ncbi:MAG: shikimate kinase [Candidatus Muproteobacteria bacterium RBG_19FT_COMBO_61_10]|uniref:Shikimate kinase n=1 Tax=Candidatus Muproteobacteria bacterium RBG_19FT_COMBO_61_10 TaxID=1817761 RepID=A0A1F6UF01_9PROT|nr:MAG: shikimate kinase [Candidatus Muproteobacteria bacterium RBG_19FT_COMBO_61_10]
MSKANNIFLVGPMGAGKTTIGRHLATLLHKRFVDVDHEIEKRTGVGIPVIFEIESEEGFRRRESAVIDELTRDRDIVLATGGGAVLMEANRRALKERGTVVYLQADIETLVERTRRDRNRPLLQTSNPRGKIEELLRQREPIYREVADVVVDTGQRAPSSVARDIVTRIKALSADENPER